MANYGAFVSTYDPNDVLLDVKNYTTFGITVATAASTTLARGCMLTLDSTTGKYKAFTGATGEVCNGVLGEDINISSADVKTFMYVSGEFAKSKITAGTGYTVVAGIFNYGNILIKESN